MLSKSLVLVLSAVVVYSYHNVYSPIYTPSSILVIILSYIFTITAISSLNFILGRDLAEHIRVASLNSKGVAKGTTGKVIFVPPVRSFIPFNLQNLYNTIKLQGKSHPATFARPSFTYLKSDTINLRTLGRNDIFTKDPLVMKHFLHSDYFTNYGKGPIFKGAFKTFLGVGIFNSDPDDVWKFHRNLTKKFFNKERITDFNSFYVDKMIKGVLNQNGQASLVDAQDIFRRFTFDASSEFLFGYQSNALDKLVTGKDSTDGFAEAFDAAGFNTLRGFFLSDLRSLYELIFGSLTLPHVTKIDNIVVYNIIDMALKRQKQTVHKNHSPEDHACVLDYLLTQTQDRQIVRDELLNLLLAGRDTTAALLTSLFVEFAKNDNVFQRARQICIELFGEDGAPDYSILNNYANNASVTFLRALLKETLRVYPPVPVNSRYAFKDDVAVGSDGQNYFIPAGSICRYSLWDMQKDEKYWGPDAKVWDPTRWLDERVKIMTENPSIFQPFSAGPRTCLGLNHAYNQATLVLVRMCQAFERVELATDVQESILPVAQLTLHWRGGAWLRLTPTNTSDPTVSC